MNRSVAMIVLIGTAQLLACQIAYLLPSTTPTPTRTRTRTPTALALPATPTVMVLVPTPPAPAEIAAMAQSNVNIRANPSTSAAVLGRLSKGDSAQIVGRTPASDWWQIILPSNPDAKGWVSSEFAIAQGPTDNIPIVQPGGSVPANPSRPSAPPTYPYP